MDGRGVGVDAEGTTIVRNFSQTEQLDNYASTSAATRWIKRPPYCSKLTYYLVLTRLLLLTTTTWSCQALPLENMHKNLYRYRILLCSVQHCIEENRIEILFCACGKMILTTVEEMITTRGRTLSLDFECKSGEYGQVLTQLYRLLESSLSKSFKSYSFYKRE